jgi:hypothetical protein
VTFTTDVLEDRARRLRNQRWFRHYFVKCACERGCAVCAYTGLVSKRHAKTVTDWGIAPDDDDRLPAG